MSNFTVATLNTAVSSSGLQGLFEPHLSTDKVRAYKPDPRAYRMAVDELKLRREEILFAAFSGWDAAGAKAFGFPTFSVNRMESPIEELGSAPGGMGTNPNDLASFVLPGSRHRRLAECAADTTEPGHEASHSSNKLPECTGKRRYNRSAVARVSDGLCSAALSPRIALPDVTIYDVDSRPVWLSIDTNSR